MLCVIYIYKHTKNNKNENKQKVRPERKENK